MKQPEVIDKTEEEIASIIDAIKASDLAEPTKVFVVKCIEFAVWLPIQIQNKLISISRLRTIIFGKGYGNRNKKTQKKDAQKNELNLDDKKTVVTESDKKDNQPKTSATSKEDIPQDNKTDKKPGHGRMPHTVYENFTEINLNINGLTEGDNCPETCGGKLRNFSPGLLVRIYGQNFADVKKYIVEKLRCDLCGLLVSAEKPKEIGENKYHESFIAMLAIQKYYAGMPFYRQEYVQRLLGFPLPDSTQYDLIQQGAGSFYVIHHMAIKMAANGDLIHNDDTGLKVLEVIKEIKNNPDVERKGMHTTCIIAEYQGHKIALFFNGKKHAGENLADVLKERALDKSPIIQMCDALSGNIPKEISTILCNCLSHGFRKFEELVDFWPSECIYIMKMLSEVYKYDRQSREENMQKEERLTLHQKYSKPIMERLKAYIDKLLENNSVEPAGQLGIALRYMNRHWEKLTRFLTIAGAPIDNNVVERALKIAIRNRKSSMFYRTCYSAQIGGMITGLIYTCFLANENPHHYLTVLQVYQGYVLKSPGSWMPWNYREALTQIGEDTDRMIYPHEHSPSLYGNIAA